MAEICLDCYNKEATENNKKTLSEKEVILEDDLCEMCGEIKPCIIIIKEKNIVKRFFSFIRRCYYHVKYR